MSIGHEGEKPKLARQQLGMDAELTNESLPPDPELQQRLMKLAERNAPHGMECKGAVATFMYLPKSDALINQSTGAVKHVKNINDVNEKFASFAISDLARDMMNFFGRRAKKRVDALDKRTNIGVPDES